MPDWTWDEFQSHSGVVHQATANTDHDDATVLKQGYDYANFSEISPDPVACWPLHEDSASTANDVVGANDGTYNGPTLGQTGLLGTTSPSFDGVDDNIQTPDNSSYKGTALTVSAWVNIDSVGDYGIVSKWDGVNWMLITDSSDQYEAFIDTGGNNSVSAGTINTGSWDHVAMTWVESGNLTLYQNGSSIASTATSGSMSSSTEPVYIGERQDQNWHIPGSVSDVRIYNQELTAGQIQTLYDTVASPGTWTGVSKSL